MRPPADRPEVGPAVIWMRLRPVQHAVPAAVPPCLGGVLETCRRREFCAGISSDVPVTLREQWGGAWVLTAVTRHWPRSPQVPLCPLAALGRQRDADPCCELAPHRRGAASGVCTGLPHLLLPPPRTRALHPQIGWMGPPRSDPAGQRALVPCSASFSHTTQRPILAAEAVGREPDADGPRV